MTFVAAILHFLFTLEVVWILGYFIEWFIMPLYPNMPQLGFWAMYGIYRTWHLFAGGTALETYKEREDAEEYKALTYVAALIVFPPVTLAVGWIVKNLAY